VALTNEKSTASVAREKTEPEKKMGDAYEQKHDKARLRKLMRGEAGETSTKRNHYSAE